MPDGTQAVIDKIFGEQGDRTVSLLLKGTNFQIRVWEALLKLPLGSLVTYRDIAQHLGKRLLHARGTGVTSQETLLDPAVGQGRVGHHQVVRPDQVAGEVVAEIEVGREDCGG